MHCNVIAVVHCEGMNDIILMQVAYIWNKNIFL